MEPFMKFKTLKISVGRNTRNVLDSKCIAFFVTTYVEPLSILTEFYSTFLLLEVNIGLP
jgi:hypothetical protein